MLTGGAPMLEVFEYFLGRWGGKKYGKFLNMFRIRLSLFHMHLHHHTSRIELIWLFQDQNGSRTVVQDPICSFFFQTSGTSNFHPGAETCIGISF